MATSTGLGFERGALVFCRPDRTRSNRALLYFDSRLRFVLGRYVLTRPLGATLGDTLTKSAAEGGLGLGRIMSSLVIAAAMTMLIVWRSQRERVLADVADPSNEAA